MVPDNFHRQSISESDNRVEVLYKCPIGTASAVLETLSQNQSGDYGYLDWKQSKATKTNQGYDTLSLIFSKTDLDNDGANANPIDRKDYDTVFELDIEYISKPLESAEKYACIWNYDLYHARKASEFTSSSPVLPAGLDNIKVTHDLDFPFMFSQTQPSPSKYKASDAEDEKEELYNWVLVLQREKPGVESYYYPRPVIREKIYFRKEKKAIENLTIAGKLKAPKETFGYSGQWLAMPDGIRKEGKYYVTVNMYKYADEWDDDLYEGA